MSSGTGSWMQTAPNTHIKHCANWKLCKALSSQSPLPVTYFLWQGCNSSTPPNSTVNLKPNIQMPEFVKTLLIQANTHNNMQICVWLKKQEKASQMRQHVTTTMQYCMAYLHDQLQPYPSIRKSNIKSRLWQGAVTAWLCYWQTIFIQMNFLLSLGFNFFMGFMELLLRLQEMVSIVLLAEWMPGLNIAIVFSSLKYILSFFLNRFLVLTVYGLTLDYKIFIIHPSFFFLFSLH